MRETHASGLGEATTMAALASEDYADTYCVVVVFLNGSEECIRVDKANTVLDLKTSIQGVCGYAIPLQQLVLGNSVLAADSMTLQDAGVLVNSRLSLVLRTAAFQVVDCGIEELNGYYIRDESAEPSYVYVKLGGSGGIISRFSGATHPCWILGYERSYYSALFIVFTSLNSNVSPPKDGWNTCSNESEGANPPRLCY